VQAAVDDVCNYCQYQYLLVWDIFASSTSFADLMICVLKTEKVLSPESSYVYALRHSISCVTFYSAVACISHSSHNVVDV